MAEKNADPDLGAAEAIGVALTADAAMQTRKEFRIATMLIGIIVLLIVALTQADPAVADPAEDLVARCEPPHLRTDAERGAGQVVAEDERAVVGQHELEGTAAELLVQLVDAGGRHPPPVA